MISGFTKAAILRAVLNGSTLAEAARQEHITTARGRSALQQLCRRLRLPAEASEIQAHVVCDFTMVSEGLNSPLSIDKTVETPDAFKASMCPTQSPRGVKPGVASAYKFIPSASCAAASIFTLPLKMTSLAVSPRIPQSTMSAHTCIRTRRGPENRAWL